MQKFLKKLDKVNGKAMGPSVQVKNNFVTILIKPTFLSL